jgi:hypothetical protein
VVVLPWVVVLPRVAVEVALPLDLEVVIPLEIPTVLRLWLLDLGFRPFSLCCTSSFPIKFSWIIHKRKIRFLGGVANHLRLGLSIKQNSKKRKIRVNKKLD